MNTTNFNQERDREDAERLRSVLTKGFISLKDDYNKAIAEDTSNLFTEDYNFLIEDINTQIKWINEPHRFEGVDSPFVPDGVYNAILMEPKLSAYISLNMYHDSIYGVHDDSSWASHVNKTIDYIKFPSRQFSKIVWSDHENQRKIPHKPSQDAVYFNDDNGNTISQFEYLSNNDIDF